MKLLLFACVLVAPVAAQIPSGYYDTVDTSSAGALRQTVHEVIDDHSRFPYTAGATDTWNILELADEDPGNTSNILDVYRNASYPKIGGGNDNYQREHTWPSSYGFPNDNPANYPYTDCFPLFLCDSGYNAARSNKPFKNCNAACLEQPTDFNAGVGGGTGIYPGNSNWTDGFFSFGTWEVWQQRRGDIARAQLYMDVRYEGGFHGITGAAEPDLILTNDVNLIDGSVTGSNESVGYHGILSVLLEWHAEDPVDAAELARQEVVYAFQGNRNPFVDHPEWVPLVWAETPAPISPPWINEFHYDNGGSDVGEFVEVAGPAGLNLAGWRVLGYNGAGGASYDTVSLTGTLPDQGGCLGTLAFDMPGLQNGAPDGLALIGPTDVVYDFISYEGVLTATDGPALGLTSIDVGFEEGSGTNTGESLQRAGSGTLSTDFAWVGVQLDTRGLPNTGQSFGDICGDIIPPLDPTGLTASPTGGLVVLDWNDNVDLDLAAYRVYRSSVSGSGYVQINSLPVVSSEFDDTTAEGNSTYFYVVTAVDAANNESGSSNETSAMTPPDPISFLPWINEIHYDNASVDEGEFIEIAGPAGLVLTGWSVVAYNGNGGTVYDSVNLAGVLPDQSECLGAIAFSFSNLQNGAPDGLALVDPTNTVVEFLSYEGSFQATSGVAAGLIATDMGVAESSSTPIGFSLQRTGVGSRAADFVWAGEQLETPGMPNLGQALSGGCVPQVLPYGCGINPLGSLSVIAGLPRIGTSMTLGVDNPLGTQSVGSLALVALALAADPGFPCGTAIPGWGMDTGAAGELLIGITGSNPLQPLLVGPLWNGAGSPSPVELAVPPNANILGLSLYAQGLLFDPTQALGSEVGLAEAVQLILGN